MEFGYSRSHQVERCKACFATDLVLNETSATLVCRECGEVQRGSMIVESPEGRNFEEENEAGRGQSARVNAMGDTAWDRTEFKGNNEDMAMQLNKLSGDARGRKEKVLERVERKTEEIGSDSRFVIFVRRNELIYVGAKVVNLVFLALLLVMILSGETGEKTSYKKFK